MTVSEVKRDKKHLCKIVFTDNSEVLIDLDVYNESPIKTGDFISEEYLEKLKYNSDYKRAKSRALWYLDRKAYSERALFEKLTEKGFSKKASAAVIARFKELGLIDDRRFAENFAYRASEQNISKREIYTKLVLKGISRDLAREVCENIEKDEALQISELIAKKYKNKLYDPQNTQKVYAALIRKGFSFGAVRDALKKYSEDILYSCEE